MRTCVSTAVTSIISEKQQLSDVFYIERAERSLQAPLQKCRKAVPHKKCREVSTTKKCPKAAPPKKCRKEGRLKICSKCSPPQKCCEAALQKVPCYVYVAPTKNVKAAPLKKYHKAATTKCFTAAPLEISLQAPPDIETITATTGFQSATILTIVQQ